MALSYGHFAIIDIIIIVLNTIELILLIRKLIKSTRFSAPDTILSSLCCSDIIVGITGLFIHGGIFLGYQESLLFKLSHGLAINFSLISSMLNLILVAADRFAAVIFPFHRHVCFSPKRVKIAICITWFISVLLASVLWLIKTYLDRIIPAYVVFGVFLGSSIFLICAYAGIYTRLRRRRKNFKKKQKMRCKVELECGIQNPSLQLHEQGCPTMTKDQKNFNVPPNANDASQETRANDCSPKTKADVWEVKKGYKFSTSELVLSENRTFETTSDDGKVRDNGTIRKETCTGCIKGPSMPMQKAERKTLYLGTAIVFLFMLSFLPFSCTKLFSAHSPVTVALFVLALCNSLVNPLLYFFHSYIGVVCHAVNRCAFGLQ